MSPGIFLIGCSFCLLLGLVFGFSGGWTAREAAHLVDSWHRTVRLRTRRVKSRRR